MYFPKDSAWEDQRARESREADLLANQDRAIGEALENAHEATSSATMRSVPLDVLEEWVTTLDLIADESRDTVQSMELEQLADSIRSHLPG